LVLQAKVLESPRTRFVFLKKRMDKGGIVTKATIPVFSRRRIADSLGYVLSLKQKEGNSVALPYTTEYAA
jgi:hypothetical protein